MNYSEFIASKAITDKSHGFAATFIPEKLFDFQRDIVRWATKKGRSAIFADCGLGKSFMQLVWAENVCRETGGDVLILAPLAVSKQTVEEGEKIGVKVNICKTQDDVVSGVNITNYEKVHHFDHDHFAGIVLDESSIIKSHTSKTRDLLIGAFKNTPYRLACTATPSPNDYMEIGNHSEFLGVMSRSEMLSMFFVHDGGDTSKWRIKGHAKKRFWEWVCSWAVMIRKPSDLGYDDGKFVLPPAEYHSHVIKQTGPANGYLFAMHASTLIERRDARKTSTDDRCRLAAEIINAKPGPWLVWCDMNAESELLKRYINGAVEVKGSDSEQHKEKSMHDFAHGKINALVSKPSIAGFGMNFQVCSNVFFVGLSDSFESYYQAVRRCLRFGQENTVNVHVVTHESEGAVVENIRRKEADAIEMAESMVANMADISSVEIKGTCLDKTEYKATKKMNSPQWLMEAA